MMNNQESIHLLPPSSSDLSPIRTWRKKSSTLSIVEYQINGSNRSLTTLSLAFVAYFAVSAGPFGVEDAVQAAGSLPVLIAVIVLPFIWGMPQALMTAELSSMMDENGGYILWVRRGLGQFAGWINAFNSVASNLCDLPMYPVLFASYIEAYLGGIGYTTTEFQMWCIKGASLLFVLLSNIIGMRVVALSSVLMSLFVLAPFVLEPIELGKINVKSWSQVSPNINWSLFLSTLIWNYQGWDSLGCLAGEVHDTGRTYPLAITLSMVIIVINYALPVSVGISVIPDYSIWKEGMLETVAVRISDWLGIWVALSAIVATLGEFNVVMACSARALWATARYRMLPQFLCTEWKRFDTPVAAVIFQTITTGFLMSFKFSELVVLDTFFNKLKYIEPDTHRPFVVPGGKTGAWIITFPKLVVIAGVLFAQESKVWSYCLSYNIVVVIAYFIWSKFHHHSQYSPNLPPTPRKLDVNDD